MTLRGSEQQNQIQDTKAGLADKGAASDKHLWYVWMGLMIVAAALLPFIARETALVLVLADMCMTAPGI